MILKELEPLRSSDPLLRAGHAAEEQLAHYLHRAFGKDPELRIFHHLRLVRDGDAAQIDHLILHRWGVILIESKSVTSRVVINAHGEWTRHFERKVSGMPSPILQAQRQGQFLRSYLYDHQEDLLAKFLLGKLQKTFTCMTLDVLVAISDSGVIERPPGLQLPEVCKADQASEKVRAILKRAARDNSLLNPLGSGYFLTADERARISDFLLEHHRPLAVSACPEPVPVPVRTLAPGPNATPVQVVQVDLSPAPAPAPQIAAAPAVAPDPLPVLTPIRDSSPPAAVAAAESGPRCRSCEGERLSILWGKFGYYFKCGDCSGNTPIREDCPGCGARKKLRKSGREFFAECAACEGSTLYFLNPAEPVPVATAG